MSERRPLVVVLAGPNGAGKTTSARAHLQGAYAVDEFVNADTIAVGLSTLRRDDVAITAGRVMLDRLRELARQKVDLALDPAVERYEALDEDAQVEARGPLDQFVRAYSFLSQVVDFGEVGLEALYLTTRALLAKLPKESGGKLDLGSEVELTHLRLEKTSEGSITPLQGGGELHAIFSGEGKRVEDERAHLSTIIEVLNERFGTVLGTADQLFFDQLEQTWLDDEHLLAQARANPIENFRLVFADRFISSIVGRMDDNADIFGQILDDPAFQAAVREYYLQRVFSAARAHP